MSDIYSQFGISPNDYEIGPDGVIRAKSLPATFDQRFDTPNYNYDILKASGMDPSEGVPVPAAISKRAEAALPVIPDTAIINDYQVNRGTALGNKLFGTGGEERFQTWPERMTRSALSLPGEVAAGVLPVETSSDEMVTIEPYGIWQAMGAKPYLAKKIPEAIARAQDTAGFAGMGSFAARPASSVGSGPSLRPAFKYEGKLYKGKEGQTHADIMPENVYNEYQRKALSGEDINSFDFGFVNHKGHFLNREKALEYAVNEGLMSEGNAKFGALTSDFFNDNRAGTAIGTLNQSGFYSGLERAVANSKVGKGSTDQWIAYLRNQSGVKPEELELLSGFKGGTKQELSDYLAENGTKLNEVWKGKIDNPELKSVNDKITELQTELQSLYALGSIAEQNASKSRQKEIRAQLNELMDKRSELAELGLNEPTKYSSYQLPGGENYRELLLTLPQQSKVANERYIAFLDKMKEKYGDKPYDQMPLTEAESAYINRQIAQYGEGKENIYQSSHWDEANPLVHIRMNDRNIDGVGKVLHLEEIQSDWHQAGRKRGYREKNPELTPEQRKELDRERNRLSNEMDEIENNRDIPFNERMSRIEPMQARIDEISNSFGPYKNEEGVPNAPFKKSWDELALKRSLTEAAKNGYDAVSWTPGEAQAARYDLSKQIDQIHFTKSNGNEGYLVAPTSKATGHEVTINNGLPIPENKLADYFGKEIAEKIIKKANEEPYNAHTLENVDLKVGGEGMKGFYDTMLPAKANALIKKMGGKVEYKEISTNKKWEGGISGEEVMHDLGIPERQHREYWRNLTQSQRDKLFEDYRNKHGEKETIKVPIIRITPQMREKITKEGFPLYSLPAFVPVDGNPFEVKKTKVDYNPFEDAP